MPQRRGEKLFNVPGNISVDTSLIPKLTKIDFITKVKTVLSFMFIREIIKVKCNSSKVKRYILGCINKDVTLNKFSFNRKVLFPLKSDNK